MEERLIAAKEILTPTQKIAQGLVWVDEVGVIKWLGAADQLPDEGKQLPVQRFVQERLCPGFIDIHCHGGFGVSFGEGDLAEGLRLYAAKVCHTGVSSFLITLASMPFDALLEACSAYAALLEGWKAAGARPLGLHLEGPWLNPSRAGAISRESLRAPKLEDTKRLFEACDGWLRMLTLAPELPKAAELAEYFKQNGVTLAMGHTEASFAQASEALTSLYSHITHLFNAQANFKHREPGTLGAALLSETATTELICDGLHLHPATIRLASKLLKPEQLVLVSDAVNPAGLGDGEYQSLGKKVLVRGGKATLEDGQTMAGSTLTLQKAMRNAMDFMGKPIEAVLPMLTLNPARALGLESRYGQIAPGMPADFVLIGEDLALKACIIGGEYCPEYPSA